MKKRPFTLTAGIVNVVISSLGILGSIIILFAFGMTESALGASGVSGYGGYFVLLYVLMIISILFLLTILILSAMTISAANKSPQEYASKKGVIIANIVFCCLYIISSLISMAQSTTASIVFSLIIVLLMIMNCVFYILDLVHNKKYLEAELIESNTIEKNSEENSTDKASETTANKKESDVVKKISELTELMNSGAITQEEFNKLKLEVLKKHLDK